MTGSPVFEKRLHPRMLHFSDTHMERSFQRRLVKESVHNLSPYIVIVCVYFLSRTIVEFASNPTKDARPCIIAALLAFVAFNCMMFVRFKFTNFWVYRLAMLALTVPCIYYLAKEPSYPGWALALSTFQVMASISIFRSWLIHSVFGLIELLIMFFFLRYFRNGEDLPMFAFQSTGLLVLQMLMIWRYEKDIRYRWWTEVQYRSSEQRWKGMIACMSQPVLVLSEHCDILYANESAVKLFDSPEASNPSLTDDSKSSNAIASQHQARTLKKVEFSRVSNTVSSDPFVQSRNALSLGKLVESVISQPFASGASTPQEYDVLSPFGTRNVEMSGTRIDWDGSNAALIVGYDLTTLKHLQQTKDQFLANCSHELRTPLNAILGILEITQDEELIPLDLRTYLHVAHTSGQHLLNLINDILDLTKIAAGQFELHAKPFSLFQAVVDSVDLISYQSSQKNLEVSHTFMSDVPDWFIGDSGRFKQVLLNLLSNAVKFTLEGSITVIIELVGEALASPSANSVDSDGSPTQAKSPGLKPTCSCRPRHLRISVRDTGVGIKEEGLSKIFTVFGKLKDEHSLNPSGSGLGLVICKQLCEQMGGGIGASSEYMKGSTFWFTVALPECSLDCSNHQHRPQTEDFHAFAVDNCNVESSMCVSPILAQSALPLVSSAVTTAVVSRSQSNSVSSSSAESVQGDGVITTPGSGQGSIIRTVKGAVWGLDRASKRTSTFPARMASPLVLSCHPRSKHRPHVNTPDSLTPTPFSESSSVSETNSAASSAPSSARSSKKSLFIRSSQSTLNVVVPESVVASEVIQANPDQNLRSPRRRHSVIADVRQELLKKTSCLPPLFPLVSLQPADSFVPPSQLDRVVEENARSGTSVSTGASCSNSPSPNNSKLIIPAPHSTDASPYFRVIERHDHYIQSGSSCASSSSSVSSESSRCPLVEFYKKSQSERTLVSPDEDKEEAKLERRNSDRSSRTSIHSPKFFSQNSSKRLFSPRRSLSSNTSSSNPSNSSSPIVSPMVSPMETHHSNEFRVTELPMDVPAGLCSPPITRLLASPCKKRVLLVEDSEFNIAVMEAFLRGSFSVTIVRNGLAALQEYQRSVHVEDSDDELCPSSAGVTSSFDVILMDCEMPVMNGYDSTINIRKFEAEKNLLVTPIIGLTAFAMSGDREKCLQAGMDDYLTKPVSKSTILSTIARWLATPKAAKHLSAI